MNSSVASAQPTFSTSDIRSVMIAVMLSVLMVALDQTIVSVALPEISTQLHGFDLLAWVVSGYLIAVAVATPIYGKLGDLYGRRMMLAVAIWVFLAASVLCAVSNSMPMLVISRVLQGIGGGGLFAITQAVVADVVAPRERGRYQGYFSATYAVASVCGPLLGGFLTHYLSWRFVFWINLPIGITAFLISRRALAMLRTPSVKRPVDYTGAVLLCAGLTALLVGVTHVGQGMAWNAQVNLVLFGVALVLLAAFGIQQTRAAEPLLPLHLFRIPTVSICCEMLFVAFFQVVSLSVLVPLRLQMLTGASPDIAAMQLLPLTLAVPGGAFIGATILSRTGRTKPSQLVGAAIVPFGLLGIALTGPGEVWTGIFFMLLSGIGIGLQFPTSLVAIQSAVPQQYIGVASSTASFSRSLGAALGVAVLTAILLEILRRHAPAAVATLDGPEIMNAMVHHVTGRTVGRLDGAVFSDLTRVAESAFQTIFLLSAGVSTVSFAVACMLPNALLPAKK